MDESGGIQGRRQLEKVKGFMAGGDVTERWEPTEEMGSRGSLLTQSAEEVNDTQGIVLTSEAPQWRRDRRWRGLSNPKDPPVEVSNVL